MVSLSQNVFVSQRGRSTVHYWQTENIRGDLIVILRTVLSTSVTMNFEAVQVISQEVYLQRILQQYSDTSGDSLLESIFSRRMKESEGKRQDSKDM